MPVYRLIEEPIFPPPQYAEPDGLLAVGGDLKPDRLLMAYSLGIFPWFGEGDPIMWWCPDPRFILDPSGLVVSRSLEKTIRKRIFHVTVNKAFREVIESCADVRKDGGSGTWITAEMMDAYCLLNEMGYAHSVESWCEGKLAGGLYGVSLGKCFFGESMFYKAANASKVAFAILIRELDRRGFELVDCQMPSEHLQRLGAVGIERRQFLERLCKGGVRPSIDPRPGDFPAHF